jgi:hypothetical protein
VDNKFGDEYLQRAPISARFPAQRALTASSAPQKLLQKNKNGSGAAIEFCGYRKVIDAIPTDLRLKTFYRRKMLSICERICDNSPRWRWKFSQTPCHTQLSYAICRFAAPWWRCSKSISRNSLSNSVYFTDISDVIRSFWCR